MSHIYVEQQNIPELVDAIFLDNVKDVVDTELDNSSDLKGNLQTLHAYNDTFNYFATNFPRLSIVVTGGQYIRFKDETLFDILLNYNNIGDGIGITTEDAGNVTSWPTWSGTNAEQTFESFDELKYFTRLTSIPQSKFSDITTLKSIDLINVTTINAAAFNKCTSLTYIDAHNATLINWSAFNNCSGLLEADISGFIPTSAMTGNNMFSGCTSIKKIIVNPGLTDIPTSFFSSCNLLEEVENLNYNNITSIKSDAFAYCHTLFLNMETFFNDKITVLNGRVFFDNHSIKNVNFPNVTTLLNNSGMWGGIFHNCSALKTAVFSDALTLIPGLCFYKCTSLESFDFSHIVEIQESAFEGTVIKSLVSSTITTIGNSGFLSCNLLTTVDLQNCISLGNSSFKNCTNSLTTVNLPSLDAVPIECFRYDRALTSVTLSQNVTFINNYAFGGCKSLTTINLGYLGITLGINAFEECENLLSLNLSSVTSIPSSCFSGCKKLTTTGIDYTKVTSIGQNAFYNCESLTDRIELTSLTSLENVRTFTGCKSITYVDISNVTSLNSYEYGGTFQGCENLETVILSPNLTHLHRGMFYGCKKLKNIDISHITSLSGDSTGVDVFNGCTSLQSITFNENLTSIPNCAFQNCSSLTMVTIPASVTSIGSDAFKSCTSMTKVTIFATTPPTLGHQNAFNYGNFDYPIYVPAESVDAYKIADKWSSLSSRIFAIPAT